jgi:hypothetical protein
MKEMYMNLKGRCSSSLMFLFVMLRLLLRPVAQDHGRVPRPEIVSSDMADQPCY